MNDNTVGQTSLWKVLISSVKAYEKDGLFFDGANRLEFGKSGMEQVSFKLMFCMIRNSIVSPFKYNQLSHVCIS